MVDGRKATEGCQGLLAPAVGKQRIGKDTQAPDVIRHAPGNKPNEREGFVRLATSQVDVGELAQKVALGWADPLQRFRIPDDGFGSNRLVGQLLDRCHHVPRTPIGPHPLMRLFWISRNCTSDLSASRITRVASWATLPSSPARRFSSSSSAACCRSARNTPESGKVGARKEKISPESPRAFAPSDGKADGPAGPCTRSNPARPTSLTLISDAARADSMPLPASTSAREAAGAGGRWASAAMGRRAPEAAATAR